MDERKLHQGSEGAASWMGSSVRRGICLDMDLVSGFVRELRGPLTSIMGASELLAEPGMSVTDAAELRRMLVRNARAFESLVSRFEDSVLMGAGALAPTFQAMDARRVAERAIRDVNEEHGLGTGEIEMRPAGDEWEPVLLDAERLRFVLAALITQALHSAASGPIVVRVALDEADGDMRRLRFDIGVEDGGRSAGQRGRECVGAAFHIGVATGLVHALGGEVCAGEGGGSFGLVLPVGAASETASDAASEQAALRDLTGVRVLLAEDGAANQKVLATMLHWAGASVQIARNGEVAVELAREAQQAGRDFDVILMDLHMPVLDGLEATGQLRGLGVRSAIIAVTADAREEDRARCMRSGFEGYLAKPVSRESLLEAVWTWSHRGRDARAA
ncbi:MAG: response regulator [Phycisphaerales bacterium]|nr:response regulator [Phycisphaerales bacterium]